MLGTLAGISITFISMRPAAQMWEALWIALPVLGDHHRRLHRRRPAARATSRSAWRRCSSARRSAGSAASWTPTRSATSAKQIAVGIPSLNFDLLLNGLERHLAAAGHRDPARHLQLHRGDEQRRERRGGRRLLQPAPACCWPTAPAPSSAPCLGSPFPPAVYVGHPGWKAAGGRISYSLATGVADLPALRRSGCSRCSARSCRSRRSCPILLYIGLVIGAQAFRAVPKAHYAAVVLAAMPNARGVGLGPDRRRAAGGGHSSAARSASTRWPNAGVRLRRACTTLGEGAVLAGMLLGAIAVVPDRPPLPLGGGATRSAACLTLRRAHPRRRGALLPGPRRSRSATRSSAIICLAFAPLQASRRARSTRPTRWTSRSPPRPGRRASRRRRAARPSRLPEPDGRSGVSLRVADAGGGLPRRRAAAVEVVERGTPRRRGRAEPPDAWIALRRTGDERLAALRARAARPPAARRALRGQGQHRRRRRADHRGVPGLRLPARRRRARRRRACVAAGALPIGKTNLDQFATGLDRHAHALRRRARASFEPRLHLRRLELRLGGRGRRRRGRLRAGHRHGRLGARARGVQRHRRPQADAGAGQHARGVRARVPLARLRVDLRRRRRRRSSRAGGPGRARPARRLLPGGGPGWP